MEILIIGGTRFLGKALAEDAVARGHQVTLFNRGQTNPDWFPGVKKIHGDRNLDLSGLLNHSWHAVIDTCGYFPRQVRLLLTTLNASIQHYTFISSISVYADFSLPGLT
jgi:2'-hydroxyisoflavone reductase